jgi:hypothetical protein
MQSYSMDVPPSAFNWDPSIQGLGTHCRSRHCAETEIPPVFTFRAPTCQADSWDKYWPTLRRMDYTNQFPLLFTNQVYNPFQFPAAPVDRTRNNFVANRPTALYSQQRSPGPIEDLETKQRRAHVESIRALMEFHTRNSEVGSEHAHGSAPRSHARRLDFASNCAGPSTSTTAQADVHDNERGFLSYGGPHHKHRRQASHSPANGGPDTPKPIKRRRHTPASSSGPATPPAPPADFRAALLHGSASPPARGIGPELQHGSAGPRDPDSRNDGRIAASPSPVAAPSPATPSSPVESYATRLLSGGLPPSPSPSPPASPPPRPGAPAGSGGLGGLGGGDGASGVAAPSPTAAGVAGEDGEEGGPGRWEEISVARLVG